MVKKGLDWFRDKFCSKCPDQDVADCHGYSVCIQAEKLRMLTKIYDEGDF